MGRYVHIVLALMLSSAVMSQDPEYEIRSGDPNGIAKWFKGRQIAHVMSHRAMDWLERPEREREEKVSRLIKNMDIQAEDVLADIGAGSGYHVFRMAPLNKNGLIYAVDIQPEMLAAIDKKAQVEKVDNVQTVLGAVDDPKLPKSSIDKMLLVDVYHEFEYPAEMMEQMIQSLKPGGLIFLVEYRLEDDWVPIKELHKMSKAQAILEFESAGFEFVRNIGNLPWQHCLVFCRPD